jgi:hypothetical protein
MAGTGVETIAESKPAQSAGETRGGRAVPGQKPVAEPAPTSRRRRNQGETAEQSVVERFFLAAESNASGDTPPLGREVPNEGEAIVESFRAGVHFFAVSEYHTRAEVSSSRGPILKKEAVKNGNHFS